MTMIKNTILVLVLVCIPFAASAKGNASAGKEKSATPAIRTSRGNMKATCKKRWVITVRDAVRTPSWPDLQAR